MASAAEEPNRRDFLVIAGNAFAVVGAAATLWPFVDQMNPDAGAQALASIEIDLTPVKEGQAITAMWRGKPIFIRNRTAEEIKSAEATPTADLPDASARNDLLPEATPALDSNRVKEGKANWLVLVGICTHLGCSPSPRFEPGDASGLGANWPGGFLCPCHGSRFDLAGRVFAGQPAPINLEIPPYYFLSDTRVLIGEEKKGA